MTWLEYQGQESKAPPGAKVLEVRLDAKSVPQSNGSVVIEGTTNLPDGTFLMISLNHQASKFLAQSKVTVVGGRFISDPLSNGAGKTPALTKGSYELEIIMPVSNVQPEAVQKIVGKKCELLGGPLMKLGVAGKIVDFSKTVRIP